MADPEFEQSFDEAEDELTDAEEGAEEPDETEETEPEEGSTEESETSEEGSEEESGESPEEETEGSEEEQTEGKVPYDRFKEVIDERNELRETKQEYEQLRQQVQYYAQTEDGARQFVEEAVQNGLIGKEDVADAAGLDANVSGEDDSAPEMDLDETRQKLQQVFPEDAAESIIRMIETSQKTAQQAQQEVEQLRQQDEEKQQEKLTEINENLAEEVNRIANSEDYPHAEEVLETEWVNGEQVAEMDKTAQQNPEKYRIGTFEQPVIDPAKVDQLYRDTVKRLGLDQKGSGSETTPEENGQSETDEQLQENADSAPMEPAGGSGPTGQPTSDEEIDVFEDAFNASWDQLQNA